MPITYRGKERYADGNNLGGFKKLLLWLRTESAQQQIHERMDGCLQIPIVNSLFVNNIKPSLYY